MENTIPFVAKTAFTLVTILSTGLLLYLGADIIVPLFFSLLMAILLNPIVNFLHEKRLPRTLSIFLVVFISLAFFIGICVLIISQINSFTELLPQLKIQLTISIKKFFYWLSSKTNVSYLVLNHKMNDAMNDASKNLSGVLGTTLSTITSTVILLFLIPVYTFIFLLYKPLLLKFISNVFDREEHASVTTILHKSKGVIQSYLNGLIIETGIVAILNTIGLYVIGVRFAILFGVIGALLNLIPYIGGLIAVALMMLVALATLSAKAAFWTLVWFMIVQFLDNNILMHYVVSSKVKINALASIVAVLVGGALCGVGGMFLAIPVIALMKITFDNVDALKPYGMLLGDDIPTNSISFFNNRKTDY